MHSSFPTIACPVIENNRLHAVTASDKKLESQVCRKIERRTSKQRGPALWVLAVSIVQNLHLIFLRRAGREGGGASGRGGGRRQ